MVRLTGTPLGILMDSVTPPFFIVDGEDVAVFASLRDVELFLEPKYLSVEFVYDAKGRLIRLESNGNSINTSLLEDEPDHSKELETALRDYLSAMKEPIAGDPTRDLDCLVDASRKFVSNTHTVTGLLLAAWRNIAKKFA